jgi:hypothetical protein
MSTERKMNARIWNWWHHHIERMYVRYWSRTWLYLLPPPKLKSKITDSVFELIRDRRTIKSEKRSQNKWRKKNLSLYNKIENNFRAHFCYLYTNNNCDVTVLSFSFSSPFFTLIWSLSGTWQCSTQIQIHRHTNANLDRKKEKVRRQK